MSTAGIVFLIGVAITVVTLAAYLIRVASILVHVNFTLGTIIAGVRAIATQVEPLGPVIGEINQDLTGLQKTLEGLVAKASGPRPAATPTGRIPGTRARARVTSRR